MYTPKSPIQELNNEDQAKKRLTELLHQAAQLEHSLLDAYLYTACSLKSTPQEFATVNGKPNQRRAIQFERVRSWKQKILGVCHEEMLHLHYVECMIRSLGLHPYLGLPKRDPDTNNWIIPNWDVKIGEDNVGENGTEIPVAKLTIQNIKNFVLYESTDAIQDKNPFGEELTALYQKLYKFELDLHFESVLFYVQDDKKRNELKEKLKKLYNELPPLKIKKKKDQILLKKAMMDEGLPPVEELKFQSIADFYYKGIQPLYEQAFDRNWVKYSNWNLNNELLNPDYAAQGFLPIGPVYRGQNFNRFSKDNTENPIDNFKNIKSIIKEIVEEGEGAENFEQDAKNLLNQLNKIGGARGYLIALKKERNPRAINNPWLAEGEMLRQSHLYRFMIIMMELKQEMDLAKQAGVTFEPSRNPIEVKNQPGLTTMTEELPQWFNAVYLAMIAWLSRIYEVQEWKADKASRMTIESLASWPLMSVAIRPFLELASFFPIDLTQLFVLERSGMPNLPLHTQQLFSLFNNPERSEKINAQMDYFAVRVLEDAAIWAESKKGFIAEANIDDNHKKMILARLTELSHLDEFKKQFPFREAGGYSDRMPDIAFQRASKEKDAYAEGPSIGSGTPLFQDTLALRIRFSGRGLVQLATDPDPTYDETGCSGTHMFHAADGNKRFDTALVWQNFTPEKNIIRGPEKIMPKVGINCNEITLMTTNGSATAGYIPLQVMNSSGAVQASGVQQKMSINGLYPLHNFTPENLLGKNSSLKINLEEKDNTRPFLNGLNHLVWQDGEPIDPFIFAVYVDNGKNKNPELAFKREIFNEGKSILNMSPIQRIFSSRGPVGFDNYTNMPDWVKENLSDEEKRLMFHPAYPMNYLANRSINLANVIAGELDSMKTPNRELIDEIISYAQRMKDFSVPKGTTVAWLNFLLHYGHTLSGTMEQGAAFEKLLDQLKSTLNIPLGFADGDRNNSNGRWLLNYTKGVMDTDSLTDLVYGELYIPLKIQSPDEQISYSKTWTFKPNMKDAVLDGCCQFKKPFWAKFKISGKTRSTTLPDGTKIIETLQSEVKSGGYRYTMKGPKDLENYSGEFILLTYKNRIDFVWNVSFKCSTTEAIQGILSVLGAATVQMTEGINKLFSPVS